MRPFALLILLAIFAPPKASAEFGIHLGGHFGYGMMGGEASDRFASRALGTFGVQALPGYKMDSLLLGPLMDLRFIGQLGESPSTDDLSTPIDFGGRSFSMGLGARYRITAVKLLLSYDFMTRHSHAPDATLKGSGWHALIGYIFANGSAMDIQYTTAVYNARKQNGSEDGLGAGAIHHWDIALGMSWEF